MLVNIEGFQFDWLSTSDRTRQAPDMSSFRSETSPGIVAIALPRAWVRGERVALSVPARRRMTIRLDGADVDPRTAEQLEASEIGRSLVRSISSDYSEYWIGLTWARQFREGVGFGITTNGAVRNQGFRIGDTDQRITSVPESATAGSSVGYDYWDLRLLWRLGLQVDRGSWSWGLTATTPSLGIYGSGKGFVNESVVGDVAELFPENPELQSAWEDEGLSTTVNSSWAFGGGGHFQIGDRSDLHLAAEWFAPVDDHEVLNTSSFVQQIPGDSARLEVIHGLDAVINVGAGLRYTLAPDRAVYGAFTTDFSAARDVSPTELRTEVALWDLYHITAGVAARIFGSDFTLGVRYSRGKQQVGELVRPLPASPDAFADGRTARTDITFHRLKIMVGVNLDLTPSAEPDG